MKSVKYFVQIAQLQCHMKFNIPALNKEDSVGWLEDTCDFYSCLTIVKTRHLDKYSWK